MTGRIVELERRLARSTDPRDRELVEGLIGDEGQYLAEPASSRPEVDAYARLGEDRWLRWWSREGFCRW